MKRIMLIIVFAALLVSAGCCSGPDLKPALKKVGESVEFFEKDLNAYWDSDAFHGDKPLELKAEIVQNRKTLLEEVKKTIKIALDPKQEEDKKDGDK